MGVYIPSVIIPNTSNGDVMIIVRKNGTTDVWPTGIKQFQTQAIDIDLVKCEECVHWDKTVNGHLNVGDHLCRRVVRWTLDEDYCSDGKRRE